MSDGGGGRGASLQIPPCRVPAPSAGREDCARRMTAEPMQRTPSPFAGSALLGAALPRLLTLAAVLLAHLTLAAALLQWRAPAPLPPQPLPMAVRMIAAPAEAPRTAPAPAPAEVSPSAVARPRAPVERRTEAPVPRPSPPRPAPAPLAQEAAPHSEPPAHELSASVPAEAPAGETGRPVQPAAPAFVEARFDADYLRNPPPAYPPMSRRRGEQGVVLLAVAVSAAGAAERVELRQGSGHARLDEAALRAVAGWRFVPARRGDQAVPAQVLVPIEFRLNG